MSPTLPLNFTRVKKCEIWPRFSTLVVVAFVALWFRNRAVSEIPNPPPTHTRETMIDVSFDSDSLSTYLLIFTGEGVKKCEIWPKLGR